MRTSFIRCLSIIIGTFGINAGAAEPAPVESPSICTQPALGSESLAFQGLLGSRCPALPVAPGAKVFADFFSRLEKNQWSGFDWNITAAQFREILSVSLSPAKVSGIPHLAVSSRLVADFFGNKITDPAAFLGFLVRVFPCVDGGDSELLALILATEFNRDPAMVTSLAITEEKKLKTTGQSESSGTCERALAKGKKSPYPLLKHFSSALVITWQDLGSPIHLVESMRKAKASSRGPEAIYLFSILNQAY